MTERLSDNKGFLKAMRILGLLTGVIGLGVSLLPELTVGTAFAAQIAPVSGWAWTGAAFLSFAGSVGAFAITARLIVDDAARMVEEKTDAAIKEIHERIASRVRSMSLYGFNSAAQAANPGDNRYSIFTGQPQAAAPSSNPNPKGT